MSEGLDLEQLYFEGEDLVVEIGLKTSEMLAQGKVVNNDYSDLFPNQFYILEDDLRSFPIVVDSCDKLSKCDLKNKYGRIEGKDLRQKIALNQMNNPNIPLVVCLAPAGCGKSYLALGSAIQQLLSNKIRKVFLIKPLIGVSKSRFLGTLPGGLEEKVAPFMDSLHDVARSMQRENDLIDLYRSECIEFVAVDFIRGRNLDDCLVIVDEVQNLNRHDLLAVITRLGKNGRMFLLGDPNAEQNDLRENSGTQNLISDIRFWTSPYTACTHLKKRMRNPIVEMAETILIE